MDKYRDEFFAYFPYRNLESNTIIILISRSETEKRSASFLVIYISELRRRRLRNYGIQFFDNDVKEYLYNNEI